MQDANLTQEFIIGRVRTRFLGAKNVYFFKKIPYLPFKIKTHNSVLVFSIIAKIDAFAARDVSAKPQIAAPRKIYNRDSR